MKKILVLSFALIVGTNLIAAEAGKPPFSQTAFDFLTKKQVDVPQFLYLLFRYMDFWADKSTLDNFPYLIGPHQGQHPKHYEVEDFLVTLKDLLKLQGLNDADIKKINEVKSEYNMRYQAKKDKINTEISDPDAQNRSIGKLTLSEKSKWLKTPEGSALLLLYTNLYLQAENKLGKESLGRLIKPEALLEHRAQGY